MSRHRPNPEHQAGKISRNIRKGNTAFISTKRAPAGSCDGSDSVPAVVGVKYFSTSSNNSTDPTSLHTGKRHLSEVPRRQFKRQSSRNYRWERLSADEQLNIASVVMQDQVGGELWAPTWHLTDSLQATVRRSGSIDYLVDETTRLVSSIIPGDPLYWFVVEESPEGRIHIHAGFLCNKEQSLKLEAALKMRFCKALEKVLWGHNKTVDVRPMWGPEGWAVYSSKALKRFRRNVGVNRPYYISQPLKVLAKASLTKLDKSGRRDL